MTETTDGGGRCGRTPAGWPQYSDTNLDPTGVLCGQSTCADNNRFCKPSKGNDSLPSQTKPSVGEPCHRRPHPLDETVRSAIVRFSLNVPRLVKRFRGTTCIKRPYRSYRSRSIVPVVSVAFPPNYKRWPASRIGHNGSVPWKRCTRHRLGSTAMPRPAPLSCAEKARRYYQRRHEAGVEEVSFQLAGHAVAIIAALMERNWLPNCSHALLPLIEKEGATAQKIN